MALTSKILFQGGVSNILFTDRRDFYPDAELYEYWKNLTQFLTWISQIERKKTNDPLFKIFEDSPTHVQQYFYINDTNNYTVTAGDSASSAVGIDNITNLTETQTVDTSMLNCTVEVWDVTGQTKKGQLIVYGISSSSTVTFKSLSSNNLTFADNDICRVFAFGRGERSVAGEAYFNELTDVWNSTFKFSLPLEITGDLYEESKLRGKSNELGRLREHKFKEAKMMVQNILLKSSSTVGTNFNGSDTFSEANLITINDPSGNASSLRTTMGFCPILENYGITWNGAGTINSMTNTFQISSGALDFPLFTDITSVIFDKRESDVIPGFCGYGFLAEIAKKCVNGKQFGFMGQVQLGDQFVNSLGFTVRELFTPYGRVQLMPTKALRDEYNMIVYCLMIRLLESESSDPGITEPI